MEKQKLTEVRLRFSEEEYKQFKNLFNTSAVKFKNLNISEVETTPVSKETNFIVYNEDRNDKSGTNYTLVYDKDSDTYHLNCYRLYDGIEGVKSDSTRLSLSLLDGRDENSKINLSSCLNAYLRSVPSNIYVKETVFLSLSITGKVYEDKNIIVYSTNLTNIKNEDIDNVVNKLLFKLDYNKRNNLVYDNIFYRGHSFSYYNTENISISLDRSILTNMVERLEEEFDVLDARGCLEKYIQIFILPMSGGIPSKSFNYVRKSLLRTVIRKFEKEEASIHSILQKIDNDESTCLSTSSGSIENNINMIKAFNELLYYLGFLDGYIYNKISDYMNELEEKINENSVSRSVYGCYLESLLVFLWNKNLYSKDYLQINKQVNRYNMRVQKLFLGSIHNSVIYEKLDYDAKSIMNSLISLHLKNLSNSRAIISIIKSHHRNLSVYAYNYLCNVYMNDFVVDSADKKRLRAFVKGLLDLDCIFSNYTKEETYWNDNKNANDIYRYNCNISYSVKKIVEPYTDIKEVEREMKRFVMRSALQDK